MDKYNIFEREWKPIKGLDLEYIFDEYYNKPIITMLQSYITIEMFFYTQLYVNNIGVSIYNSNPSTGNNWGQKLVVELITHKILMVKSFLDKMEFERYKIIGEYFNPKKSIIEYGLENGEFIDKNKIDEYLNDDDFEKITKMLKLANSKQFIMVADLRITNTQTQMINTYIKDLEKEICPLFRKERIKSLLKKT